MAAILFLYCVYLQLIVITLKITEMIDQGWCAAWLKSDLSPKLNMNKEKLSQT